MLEIREFDPLRDHDAVRNCAIELQDFEREIDPRLPSGERITDRYLDLMFRRCAEFDGVVLVAEADGSVTGFVSIWTRYRSSEPNDDAAEHGLVSDLVVSAKHRGRGIGRALLQAAEARSRQAGVDTLRVSVKAGNTIALSLSYAEGFENSEINLEKRLA